MDDSKQASLRSTSIFGRLTGGHCDLDNIALSPSSSEFSPYIYLPLRNTTSLIDQEISEENTTDFATPHYERRNSRRDSIVSQKRRNSNLTTASFQSFDNLTQIVRENQYGIIGDFDDINQITQSLPATPLTTPQTSPKFERKNSSKDFNCSLPWYYSGFIAATSTLENSSLVCTADKQTEKFDNQQARKKSIELGSDRAVKSHLATSVTQFYQQKKYNFSNRDMNFLAPTSL